MNLRRGPTLLLLAVACSACSADKTAPTARVQGAVTHRGQPVTEGSVTFSPLRGGGRSVSAAIADGRYLAEAVPLGKVRVVVSAHRKTGKTVTLDGVTSPELISLVPDSLKAGTTLEVQGEQMTHDIKLDPAE